MKRKDFIAVGAIVLIAVIALVVLMLEKNNSEFRIICFCGTCFDSERGD